MRRERSWLPLLDALVLVLAASSSIGWVFGADRTWPGGTGGPVAWWIYPAALALVALAVRRRATGSSASLRQRLSEWLVAHDTTRALRTALPLVVATRLSVFVVGYLALVTIGFPSGPIAWHVSDDPLWNMPARWDSGWYLGIATNGYHWLGRTDLEQNIVFFPAFPMAMRVAGLVLGGRYLFAGVLVSLAAFLWALVYLYRLAREETDHESAAACLALVATYPFGVFFGAAYTESLYLLCVTAVFYHFRRHEWMRAAAWGLVLGLTRPNGFVVSAPLAIMAVAPALVRNRPRLLRWLEGTRVGPSGDRRLRVGLIVAAGMPVVGLLCYSAFNYWFTGDPLAWMHGVSAWGRAVPGGDPASVGPDVQWSLMHRVEHVLLNSPKQLLDIGSAVFMGALIVPVTRRFGLPYGLFQGLVLLLPVMSGISDSLGRYTSVLFPAFIWLGATIPPAQRAGWILGFAMLQAFGAVLFFTWRPFY